MKRRSRTQAPRPVWRGLLKLSLLAIPVAAYTAKVKSGGAVDLDWLHRSCQRRIHYKKVCPVHGEVDNDEIVSGYKYSRNRYVVLEPEELEALAGTGEKAIDIDVLIPPDALDRLYFTDRTYYLAPDGDSAGKPYRVFHQAMEQEECYAIAKVVLFKREQVVVVRPADELLAMTVLTYADHFKKPSAFEDLVPRAKVSPKEVDLARTLIAASTTEHFDFSTFVDPHRKHLLELVEAKAKGRHIEPPPEEEPPPTLNFVEALKKSLAQTKKTGRREHHPTRHRRTRRRKVS